MTPEEAIAKADELNTYGKWRDDWYYYPTFHQQHRKWFVMRRRKRAEIYPAVFVDGKTSIREWHLKPIYKGEK